MVSLSLKKLVTCGVIRSFNFSVPKVPLHHSLEVVAGSRLKDWPGHKPSRAPSLEVHLARRLAYQGASFKSSIATHSNPLLGAGFKVALF